MKDEFGFTICPVCHKRMERILRAVILDNGAASLRNFGWECRECESWSAPDDRRGFEETLGSSIDGKVELEVALQRLVRQLDQGVHALALGSTENGNLPGLIEKAEVVCGLLGGLADDLKAKVERAKSNIIDQIVDPERGKERALAVQGSDLCPWRASAPAW